MTTLPAPTPERGFVMRRNTTAMLAELQAKRVRKPRPKFWDGRTHVCDYDYEDRDGRLLFRKKRFALDPEVWGRTKDFQILMPSPLPNVFLLGGPPGMDRWVYKIPELRDAIRTRRRAPWLDWAEGEKDVEALWGWEIPATTNAMGAAKAATVEQAQWLRGAAGVRIWVDKDGATGAWNAATRYNALIKVGFRPPQLKFLEATHPDDKDAADHLARYGMEERPRVVPAEEVVERARGFRPSAARRQGYYS
jgi:hypothetical protein